MKLEKLSATAMEVGEECPARFVANTRAGRGGEQKNVAAMKGSTCHDALEQYVKKFVQEWRPDMQTMDNLVMLLNAAYIKIFGNFEIKSEEYKDCLDMLTRWHARTTFEGFTVLSTESKETFYVKTSQGEIPFNFIIDRLDYLGDGVYRVIDYKTLSWPLSADGVKKKLQAAIYAMSVAIKFKNVPDPPKKIWVLFDMLRWEGPVGAVFYRDDLINTWNRVKNACEKIIEINEEDPEEILNDACGFCVRKTTCSAVSRNVEAGGINSLPNLETKVDQRALLYLQKRAITSALDALDSAIIAEMSQKDEVKFSTDLVNATLKFRATRSIDSTKVLELVGPDVFARYGKPGGPSINLTALDSLLKDPTIDAQVRADIESLIERDYADEPYLDTRKKGRR